MSTVASIVSHELALGPLSPELALVDPRLGEAARKQLGAPGAFGTVPATRASHLRDRTTHSACGQARARIVHPPHRLRRLAGRLSRVAPPGESTLAGRPRSPVGAIAACAVVIAVLGVSATGGRSGSGASDPAARSKPAHSPVVTAKPHGAPATASAPTPGVPQRLAWAPDPRANAYRVELFRGSALVLRATTLRPELDVPRTWLHAGGRERLEPGEYRWYVWPVVAGLRQPAAIVQARLVVPQR